MFLQLNNIPAPAWAVNTSLSTDLEAGPEWTAWDWLMTSQPGVFGLVSGFANPTGVVLLLILGIMAVCSMKWVRKSGNFEVRILNNEIQ